MGKAKTGPVGGRCRAGDACTRIEGKENGVDVGQEMCWQSQTSFPLLAGPSPKIVFRTSSILKIITPRLYLFKARVMRMTCLEPVSL